VACNASCTGSGARVLPPRQAPGQRRVRMTARSSRARLQAGAGGLGGRQAGGVALRGGAQLAGRVRRHAAKRRRRAAWRPRANQALALRLADTQELTRHTGQDSSNPGGPTLPPTGRAQQAAPDAPARLAGGRRRGREPRLCCRGPSPACPGWPPGRASRRAVTRSRCRRRRPGTAPRLSPATRRRQRSACRCRLRARRPLAGPWQLRYYQG